MKLTGYSRCSFRVLVCICIFFNFLLSCSYNLTSYLNPRLKDTTTYLYSFTKSDDPVYKALEKAFGSVGDGDTIKGETKIFFGTKEVQNRKVFFAVELETSKNMNTYIGSDHFLNGAIIFAYDTILVAPVQKNRDLVNLRLEHFSTIVTGNIKSKDTIAAFSENRRKSGKQILLYDFKKEKIIINNHLFKNSLSFTVTEKWPGSSSSGKVWLHKDYGVIKWIRVTGRIEEIKL